MNASGLYDPEFIEHYAKGRRRHAAEMSEILKLTAPCGRTARAFAGPLGQDTLQPTVVLWY
jgi:hypothetical protein